MKWLAYRMSDRYRPLGAVLAATTLLAAAGLTLTGVGLPEADAEPTTSPSPSASESATDGYGFTDSAARCDRGQTLMAYGRTSRAMVVICVDPGGGLEYRGVRLSDETALTAPAGRAADGVIIATNDGVTYAVSPERLLVSEGDTVLYRDSWLEFGQPRFSPEARTSTSEPTTSENSPTTSENSPTTPTATVSTTTVTVTPQASGSDGG